MDDARRLLISRARRQGVVAMDREGPRVRSHPRASCSLATRHDVGSHVGHPCLWVIRCIGHTRRLPSTRAPHQFPQPSPLRNRVPATISFTSPKLSRISSLPGPLPRPPYVATTPLEQLPVVIQAILMNHPARDLAVFGSRRGVKALAIPGANALVAIRSKMAMTQRPLPVEIHHRAPQRP